MSKLLINQTKKIQQISEYIDNIQNRQTVIITICNKLVQKSATNNHIDFKQ